MQFDVISDVHMDKFFWSTTHGKVVDFHDIASLLPKKSGTLIMAGNMTELCDSAREGKLLLTAFLAVACTSYDRVYYVLGDHEYYSRKNPSDSRAIFNMIKSYEKLFGNLKILDNTTHILRQERVVIFGGTGWPTVSSTTFPSNVPIYTFNKTTQQFSNIKHSEWMTAHYLFRKELESAIAVAKCHGYKLVVISHYAPLPPGSELSKANDSNDSSLRDDGDLSEYFKDVNLWIFGHAGYNCNMKKGGCKLYNNQFATYNSIVPGSGVSGLKWSATPVILE